MSKHPSGIELLSNAALNKGSAFTEEERDRFGLRGLLPPRVCSQSLQLERVLENLRRKESDIERYIFLMALQARNERLFYRALMDHTDEIMPIVYTPTVGQACREFAHIFRQARGFYITADDRGRIRELLHNWVEKDVRVIVVTDGERILGLGDLGANGMGIPIGKLALYTACAGIQPHQCLPVQLDVGTDNETLLADPLYLGVQKRRLRGEAFVSLIDEFVEAVGKVFPRAVIQFEDFVTGNAFFLLERYRNKTLCFNDDIQGTAGVALAGVYAAARAIKKPFSSLRVMFLGAGSASAGIADLITLAMVNDGVPEAEARKRLWLVDSQGLVVKSRQNLESHKLAYAHDHPEADFMSALSAIKPHILIGATGRPGTFTKEIIEKMSSFNEQPVVFALSNPTSNAEITAEQAYRYSNGKVVFASGSPFPAMNVNGKEWRPGQGNNAYIFPGVGLGAIGCEASRITDGMFLTAARTLAGQVTQDDLDVGALYPPLSRIRAVSLEIAIAVAEQAYAEGVARLKKPASLRQHIGELLYDPTY